MGTVTTILEIIIPVFAAIGLGVLAKRKNMISENENKGLQQFVMKFGLPCVLFNSCLTCSMGMESLASMIMVFPLILLSSLWSFQARKKIFPYYNLPMMFSAQESGMLGIPLFMTLFGTTQAYRMGVLDLAQSLVAIPVIAILASDAGEDPSPRVILKKVIQSPFLLMSLLGLTLNLTGLIHVLNELGIGTVMTEVTGFLAQPVSAVILFSVGYSFSLGKGNRSQVFKICGIHFAMYILFCILIQLVMCLLPSVEPEARWAILIYCTLPPSFLSSGFAKNSQESAISASVCSVLTAVSLLIFCVSAVAAM